MYEQWEYEIPAGTSEEDRKTVELKISLGIITDIYVGFASGCGVYDTVSGHSYYLARCRVMHNLLPIAPRSGKAFLAADDFVITIREVNYKILTGEATLTWELWNLDDTYPHKLWIGVNWKTKELYEEELAQLNQIRELLELNTELLTAIEENTKAMNKFATFFGGGKPKK